MENEEKSVFELENHIILRLPQDQAEILRKLIKRSKEKVMKHLSIELDEKSGTGFVRLKKRIMPCAVVELPTITETYKTADKSTLFKCADLCQMLICGPAYKPGHPATSEPLTRKLWPHGLTLPLKNVRRRRFRKPLRNPYPPDAEEIEKEVRWLLQMDNEAVSTRWELIADPRKPKEIIDEKLVFGELSDSDEDIGGKVDIETQLQD